MNTTKTLGACALAWLAPLLSAQDNRPLAIVNARILTLEAEPIAKGTVLIRDGKIEAVGDAIEVPPGARLIDAEGGTLMPGLVHAWSSAGLVDRPRPSQPSGRMRRGGRGRPPQARTSSRSNALNQAATKIAPSIYARQDVFGELLASGVTTLAVRPSGNGFPGLAALVEPAATRQDDLAMDDDAYVVIAPATNTQTKKLIEDNFAKADKVVEERKKPKEKPPEPKPEGEKAEASSGEQPAEKKPGEGGTPPPAPAPKDGEKKQEPEKKPDEKPPAKPPEPKKDPNIELLADLLEGKQRAFIAAGSATELLHYLAAAGERSFPAVLVADQPSMNRGRLDEVLDRVKKLEAAVLMQPRLETKPYTQTLVNPAAELAAAGVEVGFVLGDSEQEMRGLTFQLIELVRHGLPAEVALKAVTLVPAKMLKLDGEVGSIKVGKRADLLWFSGDPLDPTSRLLRVFHNGREVREDLDR